MVPNRLLILDDEIAIGELVERVAVECGFETRLAFDTDMFWNAYDDFEPTLATASSSTGWPTAAAPRG
jgi:DNA-binding response OmpR family regulator